MLKASVRRASDSGFAQIIVLGALGIVGVLLAAVVPVERSARFAAAAHERSVRIDFLSASAFRRGLVSFEDGTDDFECPSDACGCDGWRS